MIGEGCGVNHESYTALLSAYSRNGLFDKAFSLLEEMKNCPDCKPYVHTYSILIKSCVQVSASDKVDSLLSVMASQGIKRNTVTYNTLIDTYGKTRKSMWSDRIKPNCVRLCSLVRGYRKAEKILGVLHFIENADVMLDVIFFNCLVDAYGKMGCFVEMKGVLARDDGGKRL
ncbi:hypothetical protein RHSIM_Rhsim13G0055300 [Rhododendron simsii]|uniref:Pentatricopeptide repeat-containing protein n=1 Tax=Rhododendron simsii TaxID=118357 RepID=A0A834G0B5_RHOSS|nr:hypothetical protein RHSIM_Rhsim13G0055300 [Rhododendron simsii]